MLRTAHLTFAYSGSPILCDLSLTIQSGEWVALIGQNGSGKTTLVKHFNGLLKPTHGQVWVGERDTTTCSIADLAREVGYVFQNPDHQIHQSTVREEVACGLRWQGYPPAEQHERLTATLAQFRLTDYAHHPPAILGFGLRRKVALASVCALRPPVLILDEPTGGLDARSADDILTLVAQLNAHGHTILMISHDMRRVAEYARRCIVLQAGRIVRDAPPRDVFADAPLLQQAFLSPPPVTQLAHHLGQPGTPLTPEEFYQGYKRKDL